MNTLPLPLLRIARQLLLLVIDGFNAGDYESVRRGCALLLRVVGTEVA